MQSITADAYIQAAKKEGGADFGFAYMDKSRFRVSVLEAKVTTG